MRLLFDTNVLIHIEDPKTLTPQLQEMLALIRKYGHTPVIHPASFEDIARDANEERKEIVESKFNAYPKAERHAPTEGFLSLVRATDSPNEKADNEILYTLYKNNVDFLITEDQGILKKAEKIGCGERVLTIAGALRYLKSLHERWVPESTVLKHEAVSQLDVKDPFFDSLKEDYGAADFEKWWVEKACRDDRKCWCYEEDGKLKALMIIKEENEGIETTVPLLPKRRLKICTLKVEATGSKMGELFLKTAFEYCMKNGISEVYLTHYVKENDVLVALLEEFEFAKYAHAKNKNKKGEPEQVYLKSFVPTEEDLKGLHALKFDKRYYPLFRDGAGIGKFIVPIKPEYHNRLFPNYIRVQKVISDYQMTAYGNAIKKAYLCHSGITKINSGDILIFYRSEDEQAIGCIGIVEKTVRTKNPDEIIKFVGKRTVYSSVEIGRLAKEGEKQVLVILFRHHTDLPKRLKLERLCKMKILKAAPETIGEINNNQYAELKKEAGLDGHIAIS